MCLKMGLERAVRLEDLSPFPVSEFEQVVHINTAIRQH